MTPLIMNQSIMLAAVWQTGKVKTHLFVGFLPFLSPVLTGYCGFLLGYKSEHLMLEIGNWEQLSLSSILLSLHPTYYLGIL